MNETKYVHGTNMAGPTNQGDSMRKCNRELRGSGVDKYAIYKEFRDGMLCAIAVKSVPEVCTAHWNSGWKAGKDAMHERLNVYLESIGVEKMGVLRTAESLQEPEAPQ